MGGRKKKEGREGLGFGGEPDYHKKTQDLLGFGKEKWMRWGLRKRERAARTAFSLTRKKPATQSREQAGSGRSPLGRWMEHRLSFRQTSDEKGRPERRGKDVVQGVGKKSTDGNSHPRIQNTLPPSKKEEASRRRC